MIYEIYFNNIIFNTSYPTTKKDSFMIFFTSIYSKMHFVISCMHVVHLRHFFHWTQSHESSSIHISWKRINISNKSWPDFTFPKQNNKQSFVDVVTHVQRLRRNLDSNHFNIKTSLCPISSPLKSTATTTFNPIFLRRTKFHASPLETTQNVHI